MCVLGRHLAASQGQPTTVFLKPQMQPSTVRSVALVQRKLPDFFKILIFMPESMTEFSFTVSGIGNFRTPNLKARV